MAAPETPNDPSAAIPEILAFGDSIAELAPDLADASIMTIQRCIQEPWLPNQPDPQTQIDCFGFVYAGFPRKIEAVFGDDVLELAWIFTGKGEENRLRNSLYHAYGSPAFVSDTFEAFNGWRIGLRKDKPEVLIVSEELVPLIQKQYGDPE